MTTVKYSPEIDILEHEDTAAPQTKRVLMYGWDSTGLVKNRLNVDSNGAIKAQGIALPSYDYISMALSAGDTTETYTYKTGGSGGTTVATVVVVYTDSTREVLSTVTKT